ncbi:SH3 domain-containing protein [Streptomyces sp. NPDC049879]|uniref:SH3 domain-containing protein n=1 Tax=Streptomyces sp. NPDC049879 TaxID=3365598 RepID=UPI00379299A7
MKSRRAKLAALVLPLAVAATTLVNVPTASAASCGASWSNKDTGYGVISYGQGSAPLRSGPGEGCKTVVRVYEGTILYFHCYTINSAGNAWDHVRINGTNINGWIYVGNLDSRGASKRC